MLTPEHQIVAALRKIIRAVDLHSHKLHEACGMTGPQLATLQEVERLGPASAVTLARAVHLSQGTVTGILTRLESRGLISRARSETDRRAWQVTITPAGLELLATAPSLLQDRFKDSLARLKDWERSQILATLQRVASLMGADEIDASPYLTIDAHEQRVVTPAELPE